MLEGRLRRPTMSTKWKAWHVWQQCQKARVMPNMQRIKKRGANNCFYIPLIARPKIAQCAQRYTDAKRLKNMQMCVTFVDSFGKQISWSIKLPFPNSKNYINVSPLNAHRLSLVILRGGDNIRRFLRILSPRDSDSSHSVLRLSRWQRHVSRGPIYSNYKLAHIRFLLSVSDRCHQPLCSSPSHPPILLSDSTIMQGQREGYIHTNTHTHTHSRA